MQQRTMSKLSLPKIGLTLLVCVSLISGCHNNDNSAPPAPPAVTSQPTPPVETHATKTSDTETAPDNPDGDEKTIRASVEKTLTEPGAKGGNSPFPPGTRVLSVTLEDAVVTLDLSSEFNQIKSMGDTTEGLAQRALRKTLSKFANLDKMRVTVDGKPFDSEMTDWNTPFRIHYDPLTKYDLPHTTPRREEPK